MAQYYLDDISAKELAAITGCNLKTSQRWLSKTHGISPANRKLIDLTRAGHIVPESWRHFFSFVNGRVRLDGTRGTFAADDLGLYWLRMQQHDATTRAVGELNTKIVALKLHIESLQSQAQDNAFNDIGRVIHAL